MQVHSVIDRLGGCWWGRCLACRTFCLAFLWYDQQIAMPHPVETNTGDHEAFVWMLQSYTHLSQATLVTAGPSVHVCTCDDVHAQSKVAWFTAGNRALHGCKDGCLL